MQILKRCNRIIVIAVLALALGFGLTVVNQVVNTKPADATIIATYVASTSERIVRVCNNKSGYGVCQNVEPKHWAHITVNSIQVDSGCELWMSGHRKAKRKNHDWWWNSVATYSKKTIRLNNCRSGGSGSWKTPLTTN